MERYIIIKIKNELILLGHNFVSNSDTEVVLHSFFRVGNKMRIKVYWNVCFCNFR